MKKLFLLIVVVFLTLSCSSSDDNINSSQLTPPSWIHGTWARVYIDMDISIVEPFCKFTSNKFCVITSNLETCMIESELTTVSQTMTDSQYTFSFTNVGQTVSYEFIKISDTKIELVVAVGGFPNVQLEKL